MIQSTFFCLFPAFCAINMVSSYKLSNDVNDTEFLHYTDRRTYRNIVYNDATTLPEGFRRGRKFVIIIDGFFQNRKSHMSTTIGNAYLQHRPAHNIILVDWSKLNGYGGLDSEEDHTYASILLLYTRVVENIELVGTRVADFLKFLNKARKIKYADVHLIGFSLGAHTAGMAGHKLQLNHGGKISRISALDPAGPIFDLRLNDDEKLSKDDATFIDVYHTNRGQLGQTQTNSGTVNIFVNGGSTQPGCKLKDAPVQHLPGQCSHNYVVNFFAAGFTKNFTACQCNLFSCTCSLDACHSSCSKSILVGPKMSTTGSGSFYVQAGDL